MVRSSLKVNMIDNECMVSSSLKMDMIDNECMVSFGA